MAIARQIRQLLSQRWTPLQNSLALKKAKCIGIYLLAYSDKDLEGHKIDLKDIFYVGMSNSCNGVRSRLKQFLDGIETGESHSAAIRFFRDKLKKRSFSKVKTGKKFFAAITTVPCNVKKAERTEIDLKKMG
ncbi:MAG: hypothetical protein NUV34_04915, partial [Sulfuricaulis sp.]|nr:hypothetical protein [Sulfuricaulis sp.]